MLGWRVSDPNNQGSRGACCSLTAQDTLLHAPALESTVKPWCSPGTQQQGSKCCSTDLESLLKTLLPRHINALWIGEKHLRFVFSLSEALILILIYTQALCITWMVWKNPISLKEAFIAMEIELFLGMILSWCVLVRLQQSKWCWAGLHHWEGLPVRTWMHLWYSYTMGRVEETVKGI